MTVLTIITEYDVIKLSIPDMSCGHCSGAITKALKELDSHAVIEFDMPARTVSVDTSAAEAVVRDTLADAGYPPAA
jgi:copper chaperone